ncbi:uncharacterized protein VP01_2125g12 [Puccinia sorghi]|uniref:Uncharacterized protein n=1 Tax=Puccinia sorghi TaxID=27349 RepID=A0A0L6V9Y9_9BASI|nr:uncharacterized protein VP01_2125g12 [Puccinia sorghi]
MGVDENITIKKMMYIAVVIYYKKYATYKFHPKTLLTPYYSLTFPESCLQEINLIKKHLHPRKHRFGTGKAPAVGRPAKGKINGFEMVAINLRNQSPSKINLTPPSDEGLIQYLKRQVQESPHQIHIHRSGMCPQYHVMNELMGGRPEISNDTTGIMLNEEKNTSSPEIFPSAQLTPSERALDESSQDETPENTNQSLEKETPNNTSKQSIILITTPLLMLLTDDGYQSPQSIPIKDQPNPPSDEGSIQYLKRQAGINTIDEKLESMCPHYHAMNKLMGGQAFINPSFKVDAQADKKTAPSSSSEPAGNEIRRSDMESNNYYDKDVVISGAIDKQAEKNLADETNKVR